MGSHQVANYLRPYMRYLTIHLHTFTYTYFHLIADIKILHIPKQLRKKTVKHSILLQKIGAIHRCVSLDVGNVCYKSENISFARVRGGVTFHMLEKYITQKKIVLHSFCKRKYILDNTLLSEECSYFTRDDHLIIHKHLKL